MQHHQDSHHLARRINLIYDGSDVNLGGAAPARTDCDLILHLLRPCNSSHVFPWRDCDTWRRTRGSRRRKQIVLSYNGSRQREVDGEKLIKGNSQALNKKGNITQKRIRRPAAGRPNRSISSPSCRPPHRAASPHSKKKKKN